MTSLNIHMIPIDYRPSWLFIIVVSTQSFLTGVENILQQLHKELRGNKYAEIVIYKRIIERVYGPNMKGGR